MGKLFCAPPAFRHKLLLRGNLNARVNYHFLGCKVLTCSVNKIANFGAKTKYNKGGGGGRERKIGTTDCSVKKFLARLLVRHLDLQAWTNKRGKIGTARSLPIFILHTSNFEIVCFKCFIFQMYKKQIFL